jgi:hypothetical protein
MALSVSLRLAVFGCIRLHRLVACSSRSTWQRHGFRRSRVSKRYATKITRISPDAALNYSLSLPVTTAVVGMPRLEMLEQNTSLAKNFSPLSGEEINRLRLDLAPSREGLEHRLVAISTAPRPPLVSSACNCFRSANLVKRRATEPKCAKYWVLMERAKGIETASEVGAVLSFSIPGPSVRRRSRIYVPFLTFLTIG